MPNTTLVTQGDGAGRIRATDIYRPMEAPKDLVPHYIELTAKTQLAYIDSADRRIRLSAEFHHRVGTTRCGDGRLLAGMYVGAPPGLIQPFRSFGGVPPKPGDVGFDSTILPFAVQSARTKKGMLHPILLHDDPIDKHRGCAFFGCDATKALHAAQSYKESVARALTPFNCFPLIMRYDTHDGHVNLHVGGNEWVQFKNCFQDDLRHLYPNLPTAAHEDLLRLANGHRWFLTTDVARNLILDHSERIFVIGGRTGGADLTTLALVVDHRLHSAKKSARIGIDVLTENLRSDPNKHSRALLVAQIPFDSKEMRGWAEECSRNIARMMIETVYSNAGPLCLRFDCIAAVIDSDYELSYERIEYLDRT